MASLPLILYIIILCTQTCISQSYTVTESVHIEPLTPSQNGATITILKDVTTTSNSWFMDASDRIGFHLKLSLTSRWSFLSHKPSTLKVTIYSDSPYGAESRDAIISFSQNNTQHISTFIMMDAGNPQIYPKCEHNAPYITAYATGHIESIFEQTGSRQHKTCCGGSWDGMQPSYWNFSYPLRYTFINDPISNQMEMRYHAGDNLLDDKRCGFVSMIPDIGLDILFAAEDQGENFNILSIDIERSYEETYSPTINPTESPSKSPSKSPTNVPSKTPSISPTDLPSDYPTTNPSESPSKTPTNVPSTNPSQSPSKSPSIHLPTLIIPGINSPTRTPTSNEAGVEEPTARNVDVTSTSTNLEDEIVPNQNAFISDTNLIWIIVAVFGGYCLCCCCLIFIYKSKKKKAKYSVESTSELSSRRAHKESHPQSQMISDYVNNAGAASLEEGNKPTKIGRMKSLDTFSMDTHTNPMSSNITPGDLDADIELRFDDTDDSPSTNPTDIDDEMITRGNDDNDIDVHLHYNNVDKSSIMKKVTFGVEDDNTETGTDETETDETGTPDTYNHNIHDDEFIVEDENEKQREMTMTKTEKGINGIKGFVVNRNDEVKENQDEDQDSASDIFDDIPYDINGTTGP